MTHDSLLAVIVLLLVCADTPAGQPARPVAATPAVPMTLEQIEQALRDYPPAWEHGEARAAIAGSLDRAITVQVRDGMTDEDRAKLQPLLEFYRRRVDVGLDVLEQTPVTDGVLVVKFYSSSLVLKSAAGTVAVDFSQIRPAAGCRVATRRPVIQARAFALNTYAPAGPIWVPPLLAAFEAQKHQVADPDLSMKMMVDAVRGWDYHVRKDSVGATALRCWRAEYRELRPEAFGENEAYGAPQTESEQLDAKCQII